MTDTSISKTAEYHQRCACFEYPSTLEKIRRVFDFETDHALDILDIACGDGRVSAALVARGHHLYGIDISVEGVATARERGIEAQVGDIEQRLPYDNASMDVILLLDVLEHVYDQEALLREVTRILRPGGTVILSHLNHFDSRSRLRMLFGGGIVHWAHVQYNNALPWAYGHVRFLLYRELVRLLGAQELFVKKVQFNFMGGGIIPRRVTPPFLRIWLTRHWPQLFSGKYVLTATRERITNPEVIVLASTPPGL